MAYSRDIYLKADKVLDKRKETATLEAQERFDEISAAVPELADIKLRLAQIGVNISKAFLAGGDVQAELEGLMKQSLDLQERRKKLLTENGYDENALDVKYTCPSCKDTGFIKNRRCNCYYALLKELQRDKLEKIAPLSDCTFESFDINYYPDAAMENGISPRNKADKIKKSCRRYAAGFTLGSPNILFMGKTGLGKTHLSLAVANIVITRGFSVVYASAQNLFGDLQNESFGRDAEIRYTEKEVLDCDLLIIDDLGTEFKNSFTISCLYNIINTRILSKRPVIISTNYTFDELEEKYDQRITSRLAGEYKPLVLEGCDIRYIK